MKIVTVMGVLNRNGRGQSPRNVKGQFLFKFKPYFPGGHIINIFLSHETKAKFSVTSCSVRWTTKLLLYLRSRLGLSQQIEIVRMTLVISEMGLVP